MTKIELLEMMTKNAKDYRSTAMESVARNSHMNDATGSAIDQKDIDAILTDFINYVGVKQCVDFALYATDLINNAMEE